MLKGILLVLVDLQTPGCEVELGFRTSGLVAVRVSVQCSCKENVGNKNLAGV